LISSEVIGGFFLSDASWYFGGDYTLRSCLDPLRHPGWNIHVTTIFIGFLVLIYTVSGGTAAVTNHTKIPIEHYHGRHDHRGTGSVQETAAGISFSDAFAMAGEMGKLNLVNLSFDLTTGIIFGQG